MISTVSDFCHSSSEVELIYARPGCLKHRDLAAQHIIVVMVVVVVLPTCRPKIQVALLSQRGCVMLCIIEYFAKSLRVTHGHSK